MSSSTSNATLTGKVKTALASDVGLSTVTSIDVDSDNGVVTLKGRVDSADKKAKAEEIAKKVDGVKSVKNELRVEPAKDKSSDRGRLRNAAAFGHADPRRRLERQRAGPTRVAIAYFPSKWGAIRHAVRVARARRRCRVALVDRARGTLLSHDYSQEKT